MIVQVSGWLAGVLLAVGGSAVPKRSLPPVVSKPAPITSYNEVRYPWWRRYDAELRAAHGRNDADEVERLTRWVHGPKSSSRGETWHEMRRRGR